MGEEPFHTISVWEPLESPVKKVKLFRSILLLFTLIFFLLNQSEEGEKPLFFLTVLYAGLPLFYGYCQVSSRDRWLESLIPQLPDLLLTALCFLFLQPPWLLPFVSIQAVELVLEKRSSWLIGSYLALLFLAMIAGCLLTGEYSACFYAVPSFLAMGILVKMIRIQDRKNRDDHEYMKNLVDNKNKLLSTLTHELRTPLAVIKTSNELIMEERPGPINETQRSLVSSSLENTKRLHSLVENILSQVKVEFAWFTMKQRPLDIRKIIRKTALDIQPYLDTKKQILKYRYPPLLSKTLGDQRWLEQVLLNLIHNGSKNSPENAELRISVQENEQCIVVSVHDRGWGIENREISHVFNEFYQSADPAKDLNEGAGLGLTIVKDIIEKHNGQVYISSLPRMGTTVSFTLPLYKGVFSGTHHPDH